MTSPPVVCVHGFGTSYNSTWVANGWTALLEDAGREVIGIDMLGHGTAEKPTDPAAYEHLESDVLSHFPDSPVDAIGFSMGAAVLLHLASIAPERFNRLVVSGIGQNLFERDQNFRDSIANAVETGDFEPLERNAFDLPSQTERDKVINGLLKNKLLMLPSGDEAILFRPHLNVTSEDLKTSIDIIKSTIKATLN